MKLDKTQSRLWFNLLSPDGYTSDHKGRAKRLKRGGYNVGCEGCPLDREPGIRKVLGLKRIRGRIAMLWAQSPGRVENQRELELVGPVGEWLWDEFDAVGLSRDDVDIQNVVRCRPTVLAEDGTRFDRDPTKEEVAHCSGHTDAALRRNGDRAEIFLVFGRVAADALLGNEFKRDAPVYWSRKYGVKVYYFDHPSYFLRGNYPEFRLEDFRRRLKAAAYNIRHPGRYSYVLNLPVRALRKPDSVRRMLSEIRASGERPAIDIEEGIVKGKPKVLCIGFSWEERKASVILLDHPEADLASADRREILKLLKVYLEDPEFEKTFHYGSYDADRIEELLRIKVKGYTFDTTYAHYLERTYLRSHGLEAIAVQDYPKFAGYKELVAKWLNSENGLADAPLKTLVQYNGADAILTKLIELDTRDHVDKRLVSIYIGAGLQLRRMESMGPLLDQEHFAEAVRIIPEKVKSLATEIRQMADDPELNPNNPKHIAQIMYDRLKLPTLDKLGDDYSGDPVDAYNTREETLSIIHQATGHPFPKAVLDYRRYSKMESTYLMGYRRSAEMNNGELHTKWFLTGAVTGRLRSGGTKEGHKGVVNLQNLHGSPFLQNLLVSDLSWRTILQFAGGEIPEEVLDLEAFLASDYSQIEVRMLAENSRDPKLIQAFADGKDIHCYVGTTLNPAWDWDTVKKDKEIRRFVKECHFGIIFGLDEIGLFYYLKAKGVDTTPEKAAEFHREYFREFDGVARFIEAMRAFARKYGYVETIFAFRRWIGTYDAERDRWYQDFEDRETNPENQAINTPIQGSAHTLILAALALIALFPKRYEYLQKPIMEVHDAIVFRSKVRDLPEGSKQLKKLMEADVPEFLAKLYDRVLSVPILSEGSAGFRYGVMIDYEGGPLEKFLMDWKAKNAEVDAKMGAEFGVAA